MYMYSYMVQCMELWDSSTYSVCVCVCVCECVCVCVCVSAHLSVNPGAPGKTGTWSCTGEQSAICLTDH